MSLLFTISSWPSDLETEINDSHPLQVESMDLNVYLSSSPAQLRTCNREADFMSIVKAIYRAEKFVNIAVMDYFPITIYHAKHERATFWPVIDDALRKGTTVVQCSTNCPASSQ